ncbi:complement C1q tumor necrosis factor-related protein 2-like [Haliotis rufescens]|uniref:complement C1q tumor necrosis factor-related protein 2-like n=1 Tax=Haliotis rufescens TaxID=6454 RepID=UPI001EB04983|nr:complement C1q tumor necrosis factor-related protein 2-like [Haliotis rufescens]
MKVGLCLLVAIYPCLLSVALATYYSKENEQCNNCCRGLPGPQGIPGLPGMHGTRGEEGHKGSKGEVGSKGIRGYQGVTGPSGPEGPKGLRGRKGQKGMEGITGLEGPKGEQGARGYPGLKGDIGDRGQKGSRPPKVAFSVSRSKKLGPVLQNTPVTFDKIHTNLGESFDLYSSQFVCKVNGTYLFTTHVLGQDQHDAYVWIMLNNEHKMALHGDRRAGYGTGSNTIILHLVTDDHVWLQLSEKSALMNDYSSFSGYLLFED